MSRSMQWALALLSFGYVSALEPIRLSIVDCLLRMSLTRAPGIAAQRDQLIVGWRRIPLMGFEP